MQNTVCAVLRLLCFTYVKTTMMDVEAKTMVETIITRLAAERGIDENLKARDMLRWVAEMNNIKASAEEIVLLEVIYQ